MAVMRNKWDKTYVKCPSWELTAKQLWWPLSSWRKSNSAYIHRLNYWYYVMYYVLCNVLVLWMYYAWRGLLIVGHIWCHSSCLHSRFAQKRGSRTFLGGWQHTTEKQGLFPFRATWARFSPNKPEYQNPSDTADVCKAAHPLKLYLPWIIMDAFQG